MDIHWFSTNGVRPPYPCLLGPGPRSPWLSPGTGSSLLFCSFLWQAVPMGCVLDHFLPPGYGLAPSCAFPYAGSFLGHVNLGRSGFLPAVATVLLHLLLPNYPLWLSLPLRDPGGARHSSLPAFW